MKKNNYIILFRICFALFIWFLLLYIHRSVSKNYELFSNKTTTTNNLIIDKGEAFCQHHRGASSVLEKSCGNLTQNNCNSTSCCVWTSNNKCVAGKANGPTYNKDANGKTKNLDYYYYKNKCYGAKCP
jgi:hypothetical protein